MIIIQIGVFSNKLIRIYEIHTHTHIKHTQQEKQYTYFITLGLLSFLLFLVVKSVGFKLS